MQSIEIKLDQIKRGRLIDHTPVPSSQVSYSSTKIRRVGITTLGCKVNTFESELIAEMLQTDCWRVVKDREVADLYLINTCTVTKEADRQARQEVRKAISANPKAWVIVTGCYAQIDPSACAAIPGVDLVLGNDRKLDIHRLLPSLERGELDKVMVGDLDRHVSLPEQLLKGYEAHTRAFVQIQQGCDQGCTFCIIHVARGPSRSLAPSLIKRQVQQLVFNGYPEIVICGVDLGSYGQDFNSDDASKLSREFDLVELLRELLLLECESGNPFRIRLSSIDPHHISDRLIDLMASETRICPHLHLSLQSGNNLILKRMKRRYDAEHIRERIFQLRKSLPDLVLSADVMVGFPTETEGQYLDTEQLLREIKVAFPHVFSYSERNGTPAARIPQSKQVPLRVRKQRNQRLRDVASDIKEELLQSRLGRRAWVLPEKFEVRHDTAICRAEDYITALVPSSQVKLGQWCQVEYSCLQDGMLVAHPV